MFFARTVIVRVALVSLALLAGRSAGSPAQGGGYDQCGSLVQGVTCVLFQDQNSAQWVLENMGGFQVGDVVRVTGVVNTGCITICQQGSGCIEMNTIGPCSAGTPFCFGDGSGTACPCGNSGATGHGCENSFATGGGVLSASGTASVSADTVVLAADGLPPTAPALYFQGTDVVGGGLGLAFGDGLRCAGGTVIRLGTKTSSAGSSSYPGGGDPSVSVKGMIPAGGGTLHYQVWYRNNASFCTAEPFNLTNGLTIAWSS